jgi:hypothetical protein
VLGGAAALAAIVIVVAVLMRGSDSEPTVPAPTTSAPAAAQPPAPSAPASITPAPSTPPASTAASTPAATTATTSVPAATTPPPPPAAPGRGTLVLDALPFAEIVSIVDGSGAKQPVPPNQMTPFVLAVPAGDYQITLRNGSSRTVRVRVPASGSATIPPVDFGRIDSATYFKGLGW